MNQKKITAIILSGGTGTRVGTDIPKQYIKVNDRAVIAYSLEVLSDHPDIDALIIVAADNWHNFILDEMKRHESFSAKFASFASPGENRQLSILNALKVTDSEINRHVKDEEGIDELVMIHDAARPNLSKELISRLIEAYDGHEGVMPAEAMKNTLYTSDDGSKITGLLDRSIIFAGHTPELFDFYKYYEANRALLPDKIKKINGSSEPALLAGMDIVMVENDVKNYKITTKEDLAEFTRNQ